MNRLSSILLVAAALSWPTAHGVIVGDEDISRQRLDQDPDPTPAPTAAPTAATTATTPAPGAAAPVPAPAPVDPAHIDSNGKSPADVAEQLAQLDMAEGEKAQKDALESGKKKMEAQKQATDEQKMAEDKEAAMIKKIEVDQRAERFKDEEKAHVVAEKAEEDGLQKDRERVEHERKTGTQTQDRIKKAEEDLKAKGLKDFKDAEKERKAKDDEMEKKKDDLDKKEEAEMTKTENKAALDTIAAMDDKQKKDKANLKKVADEKIKIIQASQPQVTGAAAPV